jgi:hypothetical protein
MKIEISTFQKINIIAIAIDIIAFFIPVLIDISDQRSFYFLELSNSAIVPIVSLSITGLVAAIINTIVSFKGLLDMCIQYISAILMLITPFIFTVYLSFILYYGFSLGYSPLVGLLSGILITANTSTEMKNYNIEELILPKEIVIPSIWNLIIRNILTLTIPFFILFDESHTFLVFFIIRSVLDIMLIFGARSIMNNSKLRGMICLICIAIMTLFDVWILFLLPKNSFFAVWLILLGIPFLYQLNGSIKIFRTSREL